MHILSLGDAWSSIRRKEAGDHSSIHSQEGPETYSEDGKETNPQNTLVSEWELLFIRSNVQCTRSHKHTFYSLLQNQQYHLPHCPLLQPPLPYLAEFAPQSTGQLPVTLSTSRSFWSLFSKCNMCVAYRRISRWWRQNGLVAQHGKELEPFVRAESVWWRETFIKTLESDGLRWCSRGCIPPFVERRLHRL